MQARRRMEDVAKDFRGAKHLAAARPWAFLAEWRKGAAKCDQREGESGRLREGAGRRINANNTVDAVQMHQTIGSSLVAACLLWSLAAKPLQHHAPSLVIGLRVAVMNSQSLV